jgi:hypothetical protein
MIVLASSPSPVAGAFALCFFYCSIRVVLRQSVHASATWSNLFEMAFPVFLLALTGFRSTGLLWLFSPQEQK